MAFPGMIRSAFTQWMRQLNISTRLASCLCSRMTSRASLLRIARCRSSGGRRIPRGIPGSGAKSLHGAAMWPTENSLTRRQASFPENGWLPYFLNFRRDGYDFDALWEDGKASYKQKRIMDLYAEELQDREYYSNELKRTAGFGKDG
jgi:hypothetical protein